MKLSLKFREETRHQNPLLRAKVPVTVLGFPFLTGIVAGDSSDLSFSLRSNFSSGPSLSLSYHPTLSPPSHYPFSLSLKSGIGVFGSPQDSPITFSANFNPNSLTPTFSLLIKPQLGNFSLFKSVSSDTSGSIKLGGGPRNGELSFGSASDFEVRDDGSVDGSGGTGQGKSLVWRDLKRNSSLLSGILVAARTSMPLTNRAVVNFRWGVSFPSAECGGGVSEAKPQFPVLLMNKISLERVDGVKKDKEDERKKVEEAKAGDFELLKGMCSWMRREVVDLQRENREMKQALEGMRFKAQGREKEVVGKRMMPLPSTETSGEFERWRSKKAGGNGNANANGSGEEKSTSKMSEVENELQKAIKAASS
ncbi:hypothetical protein SOVF_002490 [Spinacia oleracea]|uniref:Uncharacterized protein LOC110790681 n=1 Tax=Spinacia oleracea TaxID=3562 RepID=A0A9R0IN46_SPIOL|nr:uncharacterized protein LOC110790681 [Spinacia oleracea]XP_056689692.1 uncharacterized protein LOC110790681 [Spinacia oleracea]KNA25876.1 hypothetical protein SOVF_002490 [Spinacia oleracea]